MMNDVSRRIIDETHFNRIMDDAMVHAQNLAPVGNVKAL